MSFGFGAIGQGPLGDSQRRLSEFIIKTAQLGSHAESTGYLETLATVNSAGVEYVTLQGLLENVANSATGQIQHVDVSGSITAVANIRTYQVFQNLIIDASLIVEGQAHTGEVQHTRASEFRNDTVGDIRTGQLQVTVVRGSIESAPKNENIGGSGVYYGPWGAPFVLPFAKEYEEVNGKRRRKFTRLAVATRFSRTERWQRTHYNLDKMHKGVSVAASNFKELGVVEPVVDTGPKITVNASTLRLIKTHEPRIDVSKFTVVESKQKYNIDSFIEKHVLVETGTIKNTDYEIDARVIFDSTSFKVTVELPKSTVDA